MQVLQFIASSPAAALEQIQKQLGPEAVVLSVRPLPVQGFAKFLPNQSRIEVLAGIPEVESAPTQSLRRPASEQSSAGLSPTIAPSSSHRWKSIAWLESMGLLPDHADRLQAHVSTLHGSTAPEVLEDEWTAVSHSLSQFWRPTAPIEDGFHVRPHVFIGPAGSGKTTALCKWLTLASLMEERPTRVFRLDGSSANTADYLTIHCEMLGTPVERFWSSPANRSELVFVDLPGIDARDPQALQTLNNQLASLPTPHVHLVLNAAYDVRNLLAQYRAFSALHPHDIILTHLDEEPNPLKLWNLPFAATIPIRYLSSGQKIPGEFRPAKPELLFSTGPA